MPEGQLDAALCGPARQLHQARSVGGGHHVRFRKGVELVVCHPGGHRGELHAEEATESTAFGAGLPGKDSRTGALEECDGLTVYPELTLRVASMMVRDGTALQTSPHRFDSEHVHQELGQLERPGPQLFGAGRIMVIEDPREVAAHHAGTAPRGQYDVFGLLEDTQCVGGHASGFRHVTGVESRLPTARLPLGEGHRHAQIAKETHGIGAGVREEPISDTGGEEGDTHG